MFSGKGFRFALVLIALLMSVPAFAQKETGTIVGTIKDAEGVPLPGVAVTAVSASRGSNTTYTDKDGFFRFPAMPPAIYEVRAELSGFQKVIQKEVRVFVGASATVDLTLQTERLSETIEILGETPLVDVTTPATSQTVPVEAVENMPKSTFALDLFTLTPGVGTDYVAYGAGGDSANAYWFDGVDVSDPEGGTPWMFPNYNWIEEVQVVGVGAPAEYGGFTGVVSNSVSRSGGNTFHGLVETFFQNDSLTGKNSDNPDLLPPTVKKFSDTTAQIGGPIAHDKVWFFTGMQYFTRDDVPLGYNGTATDVEPRWIGKVTYKVNESNTLQGFSELDRYDLTGRDADASHPKETTVQEKAPEATWNATWISLFGPQTVLDVRMAGFWGYYHLYPENGQTPGHLDSMSGLYSINSPYTYLADRGRVQVNASVSHYARDFIKGNHDFKFGAEFERSRVQSKYYYNGGIFYYDYLGAPYYRYLWQGYDIDSRIHRVSSYAQDSWDVTKRLNLALGVRWDHNRGILVGQGTVFKSDPVAPRIGTTIDVLGNHKTVLKAHYGHYYEAMFSTFYSGLDNYADYVTEWFNGENWEEVARLTHNYSMDQNIKHPYVQQFTAGIDQELPKQVAFGAHYIYRRWKNIIEDVNYTGVYDQIPYDNPITGQTMMVYNQLNPGEDKFIMTNTPSLYRRYDGVEVFANKRVSKKLYLSGSVVWSRAVGNIGNTSFSLANGNNTGQSNLFNDPNYNINIDGKMPNDPTWEIKFQGVYSLPWWGINTSWYYHHTTGDTWTPRVRVGGLDQGAVRIFGLPRGSERLPAQNIFDCRFEKQFAITSQGKLKFTVDMLNLFNTGYTTEVENRYGFDNYGEPLTLTYPREIRIGARYEF